MQPEDLAALAVYLTSEGSFSDLKTPIMFIRKAMDPETFRSFSGVMAKAINIDKKSHSVPTILDALRATVMDRVPLRARQAKMFRCCKKKGLMGRKG